MIESLHGDIHVIHKNEVYKEHWEYEPCYLQEYEYVLPLADVPLVVMELEKQVQKENLTEHKRAPLFGVTHADTVQANPDRACLNEKQIVPFYM